MNILFTVSFRHRNRNIFHVHANFTNVKKKKIILRMPVWAPGSYLVRDFVTQIHQFRAYSGSTSIDWKYNGIDGWEIKSDNVDFTIEYLAFANELTVRTSYIGSDFAFINPPALFPHPEGELNSECRIEFIDLEEDEFVYTTLSPSFDEYSFTAKNFDIFYDSPMQASKNEAAFEDFYINGKCHMLLIESLPRSLSVSRIASDMTKSAKKVFEIFGFYPFEEYYFFLNFVSNVYGGLEHLSSSANMFDPSTINNPREYNKLLGLLTHEYFHAWNGKCIHPKNFGPFQYQNPVLTEELWIVEGITSYYDNYILLLSGLIDESEWLSIVSDDAETLMREDGENWMSLKESSLTTWIKFYKQAPYSNNTGISYYTKGAIISMAMDIWILECTAGKKRLSDVMRLMGEKFGKSGRGYTAKDFFRLGEKSTGLKLKEKFYDYIIERKPFPFADFFSRIGIILKWKEDEVSLGFTLKDDQGKAIIAKLFHREIGDTDLNLGDEILALDGIRIKYKDFETRFKDIPNGSEVNLLISRRNKIMTVSIHVKSKKSFSSLQWDENPTESVQKLQNIYLAKKEIF